ncbi:T9SS type A sorting domain-containing protein [Flavobacterium sp.]|uniref:NHL domain-containing protein n=1 Tax=Flavobacterium sp. TaxID=239 RepID=UPI00352875BD
MKVIAKLYGLLITSALLAQTPNISYNTPNSFVINQPITALFSINTGGNIPTEATVSTFAGTGTIGSTDANGTSSQFYYPTVVVLDNTNAIIVVDRSNHKIRKIDSLGNVTTIAGTGTIGSADGTALSATFKYPDGAIVDSYGNIFITDQSNHRIRKIDVLGNVTTFAGGTAGYLDGIGVEAKFYYPAAMAIDNNDNLFIADWGNHCIRKITPLGVVSTYAGIGGSSGSIDGNILMAKFNGPTGLCFDNDDNLYVADYGNHKIRKIDAGVNITTFCGTGTIGNTDGISSVTTFNHPAVIAFDGNANFYVTDEGNHKIRKINSYGTTSTLAGTGTGGFLNGTASAALFNSATGIVVKNKNELFIADYGNHSIRKIQQYLYTISPNLPEGLLFNEVTGEISGTPTQLSSMTDYTVTATNEFGTASTIVSIEVATLSTSSFQNKTFKIYPNPFENDVFLDFENEIPKEVVFYNTLGQKILKVVPTSLSTKIDFKNHNSGIYFVKLNFDSKTETLKLIKKQK